MRGLPPYEPLDIKPTTAHAYVTLLMRDDRYAAGCLVVAHSLRTAGVKQDLVCMVTMDMQ